MRAPKPAIPSEQDIARALRTLRSTTPLCRIDATRGNEGFTASLSFNPVEHRTSAADFVEVALRTASFTFSPADPKGWSWGEGLKAFVHHTATETTVKQAHQANATQGWTGTSRTELHGDGGVELPLVGQFKAGVRQAIDAGRSTARTVGQALEVTRSVTRRWAEIHRRKDDFELRLGSPGGEDLVRLNADLDRIGILSSEEPASVDLDTITATLRLQNRGSLEHALRFRDAGGSWSRLIETREKQVVSELMFAKFLRGAHRPLRLWPRKA
jgi:hypothetical protein